MKPTVIAGADVAMHAPEGWDEDRHGKCETIQARDNGDGTYSLGWRPSRDELEQLALGAAVVIDMWGGVAPHCLKVEDMPGATSPFSEPDGAPDTYDQAQQALDRNAAANAGEKPSALRDDETPESREAKAADAFEESRRKQEAIIAEMKREGKPAEVQREFVDFIRAAGKQPNGEPMETPIFDEVARRLDVAGELAKPVAVGAALHVLRAELAKAREQMHGAYADYQARLAKLQQEAAELHRGVVALGGDDNE